jgi:nicotinate-nucleotide adenylyltransferase
VTWARGEDWSGARIGVLGGTFDPPHVGHARMAAAARDVLALDQVFFSVAPHPPHKPQVETTAYAHRFAMAEAAVTGEERIGVTRIEEAHETSYTVDLLRACRTRTGADLYFLLGADSMSALSTWREPDEVMRLATLVVFARGGEPVRAPAAREAAVVVFEHPVVDVSSREIRERARRGEPVVDAVAPAVAEYIARHRLYSRD